MITINFLVDENILKEDLKFSPHTAIEGICVTYFLFPVSIKINGKELIGSVDGYPGHHHPAALIGFCHNCLRIVNTIKPGQKMEESISELDLDFFYEGDMLHISSPTYKTTGSVPIEEARLAFADFACRVRDMLLERVPNMNTHPNWKEWFPDDLDVQAGRV